MENMSIVDYEFTDGTIATYVIIDRGNGEYTSILKSEYDAMQAEQSTPSVIDEA